jgi:hypothetical protein
MLYEERLSTLTSGLNEVCLAPAAIVLLMSGVVSILALGLQVVLIRLVLLGSVPTEVS